MFKFILVALILLIAFLNIALSVIRERDRKRGLEINEEYYTVFGILFTVFVSPEKRRELERKELFWKYSRKFSRGRYITSSVFLLVVVFAVLLEIGSGLCNLIPYVAFILICVLQMVLKRSRLLKATYTLVLIFAVLGLVSDPLLILPFFGMLPLFVWNVYARVRYFREPAAEAV